MRNTNLLFAFMLTAMAAHASEPTAVPPKAIKVAREFMVLLYNDKAESVVIDPVKVDGTFVEVQARSPGKVCSIKLQPHATANADGCVVSMHACQKAEGK